MNRSTPLVSVVIPTFNRPKFLLRAVRSALAGMDVKDIEVIVVPNGPERSFASMDAGIEPTRTYSRRPLTDTPVPNFDLW